MSCAGKRVLLVLMGLEIGGAETHVVELAKELSRRGLSVFVASNGGVYTGELRENGICHFKIPLHNKLIHNVIKSYFALGRIIRENKIDIVHAHARIPGFICGLLQKKMGFTFVTTAHWVFKTGWGLKYLTDWGEKTVAVSEDIKDYLIKNYKTPPENIFVTINGVDTERFSPSTSPAKALVELGAAAEGSKIVYCSRLDSDRSLVAYQLIEIAAELAEISPSLEIIIVGDGDRLPELRERAGAVNSQIGRRMIVFAGGRTDVNEFIAAATVFVGVSRAALEAMAASKPVIIAGNEGYIGLFDKDKQNAAVETNFTCRGCPPSGAKQLKKDIITALAMDDEERERTGAYGRGLVLESYSVRKMANDNILAYKAAEKENRKIIISGYYGFKNCGDDALLHAILKALREKAPASKVTVLSKNPGETAAMYNVSSINRFNPFKIIREMRGARLLISGGGSLLQDVTSTLSLWYYTFIIAMAKRHNLKIMIYANGIGPINKKKNIPRVRRALARADLITLREEMSLKEIARFGDFAEKTVVTADPALSLSEHNKEEAERVLKAAGADLSRPILIVSVRKWKGAGPEFAGHVARGIDAAAREQGLSPVLLPMQHPEDCALSKRIIGMMKTPAALLGERQSVQSIMSVISRAHIVVAMRLHTLIFAAGSGVPAVGLVYDPKVKGFMDYVGQSHMIKINNVTGEALAAQIAALCEDYDERRGLLRERAAYLAKKADENASLALELIEND